MYWIAVALVASGQASSAEPVSPKGKGHCTQPRWSRDGSHLAYRRWEEKKIDLEVLWDLKRVERVKRPQGQVDASLWGQDSTSACRHLGWGPSMDPKRFVYTCSRSSEGYGLYLEAGKPIKYEGDVAHPVYAPDRDAVVFMGEARLREARCRRLGPSCGFRDTVELSLADGAWGRALWIPGGHRIAERHDGPGQGELWLIPKAGKATALTRTPGFDRAASVSPDGKLVAWFSKSKSGRGRGHELWVLSVKEPWQTLKVADDALLAEQGPGFLPDGSGLVYVRDAPREADPIVLARWDDLLETVTERRLKTNTVANQGPVVEISRNKTWRLAVSALGRPGGKELTWRRIFVSDITPE